MRAPGGMTIRPNVRSRAVWAVVLLVALTALYWILSETGALATLTNRNALHAWIEQLGYWGPAALIAMMIAAIVLSPIPSGPIAMVAGATYGSLWGTVFVVVGAEVGALIAFAIARSLGFEAIQRWSRLRPVMDWLGKDRSQGGLMGVIFASRLVPFISFDAVSYAAGLTPLAFWRFLVATLAGIIPTAYLITTFGEVLIGTESGGLTLVLILISSVTVFPLVVKLIWAWRRKRKISPK